MYKRFFKSESDYNNYIRIYEYINSKDIEFKKKKRKNSIKLFSDYVKGIFWISYKEDNLMFSFNNDVYNSFILKEDNIDNLKQIIDRQIKYVLNLNIKKEDNKNKYIKSEDMKKIEFVENYLISSGLDTDTHHRAYIYEIVIENIKKKIYIYYENGVLKLSLKTNRLITIILNNKVVLENLLDKYILFCKNIKYKKIEDADIACSIDYFERLIKTDIVNEEFKENAKILLNKLVEKEKEYDNAGLRWTKEEDEILLQEYNLKYTLAQMVESHKRSFTGIISRLRYLLDIDQINLN